MVTFAIDEEFGVRVDFHLYSSTENRLSLLELDAEQVTNIYTFFKIINPPKIIRTAPLPKVGMAQTSKSDTFTEFCDRNKKKDRRAK